MPFNDEKLKKLLILAGTHFQIPVIEFAKKQGHYVITCDNKPNNPGHKIADEYINVSTTDIEKILDVAKREKIDGILAYGSDPAAPTAAFVSEKLNLPGNSYNSVLTLTDKSLFRKFLSENNFPVPINQTFNNLHDALSFFNEVKKNMYVKPVDSSGSKGITKIEPGSDLTIAFKYAMEFSRKGKVIIEEEIIRRGPNIHGEAFIYNGEIVFMILGDQYFSSVNECAPISTTLPSMYHYDIMDKVKIELAKILNHLDFKYGGLNIEIIRDYADNIYFIEIGARNGGNYMPDLATLATGFDLAAANVNVALGEPFDNFYRAPDGTFSTQYIIHSHKNGVYSGLNLDNQYSKNIKFIIEYFSKGDIVQFYSDSRKVIGILLLKFENKSKCMNFINYIHSTELIKIN